MVFMTDQELGTRVKDQIRWDGRVPAADIEITIEDSKAILRGTVPSYRAKMAAAEDAWVVSGIQKVDNQLQVKYPPAVTVPPDSEIASSVETVLVWEPDIDSANIEVSVTSGVVTLRGTVDAYWKKYQAEQDAYGIAGVIDVINELGVVLTDKPLDQVIARDIEAALARNSHVNVEDVTVAVDNGTVILGGNIPNWAAWRSAYNAAIYTTGVIDVVDQLNIVYS